MMSELISVKTKCKSGVSALTFEERKFKIDAYAKDGINLGDPSVPWADNPTWYLAAKLLLNSCWGGWLLYLATIHGDSCISGKMGQRPTTTHREVVKSCKDLERIFRYNTVT